MHFIKYDDVDGIILGLDIEEKLDINNGWVTASDEAYNFVLEHNGQYIVDVDAVNSRIEEYREKSIEYMTATEKFNEIYEKKLTEYKEAMEKFNELDPEDQEAPPVLDLEDSPVLDYIVVEKQHLIFPEKHLSAVIRNRIRKNMLYCGMFIENGVDYQLSNGEKKHYSYKIEDQINYQQLKGLISQGVLNDETGIPIKADGEDEYTYVSVEEFDGLYKELIKNKMYQLFYLRQYNEYTRALPTINDVHRLQYEMILPEEYQVRIDEQMSLFERW